MAAMIMYVRWLSRHADDAGAMERSLLDRSRPAPVPDQVHGRCAVTEREVDGRRVVTLAPRSGATGVHVIHTHGGAYVYAIQAAHWRVLAALVESSGAVIHVPLYGLAPRSHAAAAHEFLDRVYADVLASGPDRLVLSGDSAGGGLALGQAIRRRDVGAPLPAELLLFSPWLDVAVPDRVDRRLERREPMLSVPVLRRAGLLWAGSAPLSDPAVSPLHASLEGLPPITTFVGGRDLLVEDAQRLDEKVRAAGGASCLRVWSSGFHVFMAATRTREAREVMAEATALLRGVPRPTRR